MEKQEIIAKFRKRRTIQLVITVAIVPVMLGVWYPEFVAEWLNVELEMVSLTGLVLILGMVAGSVLNFRCPKCNKYLGRTLNPAHCPKCNSELYVKK